MKKHLRRFWLEWVKPLLVVGLVTCAFRSAIADWNDVPSGSMRPTLLEGDRVVVNKLAYDLKVPFTTWHLAEWDNPARGDIIVFKSPKDGIRLVKRVIGLPGDTIEMRGNELMINGVALNYSAAESDWLKPNETVAREELPSRSHVTGFLNQIPAMRSFAPFVVPAEKFFVMGDSRDNSFDSRYFGGVPREAIYGRATAVAFSLDYEDYYLPRAKRFFRKLE